VTQRLQDIQQAIVLLCIVGVFVTCHGLRVLLNVNELIKFQQFMQLTEKKEDICIDLNNKVWKILPSISHFLLQLNGSANFFVYCLFNRTFRNVLKKKIRFIISKWFCVMVHISNNNVQNNNSVVDDDTIKHSHDEIEDEMELERLK
jgi:hypothetical protein